VFIARAMIAPAFFLWKDRDKPLFPLTEGDFLCDTISIGMNTCEVIYGGFVWLRASRSLG
jgi:hypothetical protein